MKNCKVKFGVCFKNNNRFPVLPLILSYKDETGDCFFVEQIFYVISFAGKNFTVGSTICDGHYSDCNKETPFISLVDLCTIKNGGKYDQIDLDHQVDELMKSLAITAVIRFITESDYAKEFIKSVDVSEIAVSSAELSNFITEVRKYLSMDEI